MSAKGMCSTVQGGTYNKRSNTINTKQTTVNIKDTRAIKLLRQRKQNGTERLKSIFPN